MTRRLFEAFEGVVSVELSNALPLTPVGFPGLSVEEVRDDLDEVRVAQLALAPHSVGIAEEMQGGEPDELGTPERLAPLPATYIPDVVPFSTGTGG